jgi:uncharacterized phiE125 gp8 family phage protein
MELCKLTDVKAWLGLKESDDDPMLSRLILATSADFARVTNRPDFGGEEDYTDVFTGDDAFRAVLRHFPITEVTKVTVDGVEVEASADGTADGWYVDVPPDPERNHTVLLIGSVFTDGVQCAIEYSAGYAEVPADIAQAVIEWVAYRYRSRGFIGQQSKHLATGETVSFQNMLMPEGTKAVAEHYRRDYISL